MDLTVRERKVLADMERALTQEDPHLARQLARMRLTHRREARPAPAEEAPPTGADATEHAAERAAAPDGTGDDEPGAAGRRVAKGFLALALVLFVVSVVTASPETLYAAETRAACLGARSAARRE